MITRINQVREYRVFQRWAWTHDVPDFSAVNLIYGINGTGKSTLASLLRGTISDEAWQTGLDVSITDDDGRQRKAAAATDPIWQNIRVFNRDYIDTNLKFDEQSGSSAAPLLVLGQQRVEQEEELAKTQRRLDAIADELPKSREQLKKDKSARDLLATDTARLVGQELGSLGGRYAPRSYNAATVKQVLNSAPSKQESTGATKVSDDLLLVQSDSKQPVSIPPVVAFSLVDIADATRAVLVESAVSTAIASLVDNPDHARWVQNGLSLHEHRDTCIFCEGPLTEGRRHALASHFDESLRNLEARITELEKRLAAVRTDCEVAINALPSSSDILQSEVDAYRKARTDIEAHFSLFILSAERISAQLRSKRDSLFSALDEPLGLDAEGLTLQDICNVMMRHNATTKEFDSNRLAAAKRIEEVRVAGVADQYRDLTSSITDREKAIEEMVKEERGLQDRRANLSSRDLDAQPIAKQLNRDLAQLLGREDLKFRVEGRGYGITRNGAPAQHLSEGERNAISLLYFLRSLESHDTRLADCLVVIDDPVSSLDDNAIVGASTHLWTRLVGQAKCRQLFLLTHNFELFRMWTSQLDRYPQRRDAKLAYGIYEMRCTVRKATDDTYQRVPILLPWPNDKKVRTRLRSEYHYLFWRVSIAWSECNADPSPERDVEAATILPNACRRLLEGFLGFKYPDLLGNLHDQIMEIGDDSVSEAMRSRVLRFVHAYSHNESADTTASSARPESVEMLGIVLEFIKTVDPLHFEAMCRAVHVDGGLVGQAAQ
jgi:wobble nucleotide-excising tRNase